jgi:2-dehydropantoate 2-reductase
MGGEVRADVIDVAAVEDYGKGDQFDLILLATKAQDALEVAPHVVGLLAPKESYCLYRMAALHGCLRTV